MTCRLQDTQRGDIIFAGNRPAMNPFKQLFVPPIGVLETSRLRIRVDSEEMYTDRFRNGTDDELMAWCGFARPEDLELQKRKVTGGFSTYRTSNVFFHLIEKQSELVIGSIAFHSWYEMHRRSELGYGMNSEAHKNLGFMKEAMPAVLQFGFDMMSLNRVEAFIGPENTASRRLVEGCGFRLEGQLREHFVYNGKADDSVVYGLLKADWNANRSGT